jgi:hypothetical protein
MHDDQLLNPIVLRHPFPQGVERVFTPQGLELYIARPISSKPGEPEESPDFFATWWLWHGERLERMDSILCIQRSHGLRSQSQWSVFTSLDFERRLTSLPDALSLF